VTETQHLGTASPATVGGGDRLRLFCGLTLPGHVLDLLAEWQERELRGGRIVRRENLHITLAFLGSRPAADAGRVAAELGAAAAATREAIRLRSRSYRETRSVGMLVLDDDGARASRLATDVHERLERLRVYQRERRPWLPHVTVLRFRRPPRLCPALPDLGEFSPSGVAVYHSLLRPGGARYEVLQSFALGG